MMKHWWAARDRSRFISYTGKVRRPMGMPRRLVGSWKRRRQLTADIVVRHNDCGNWVPRSKPAKPWRRPAWVRDWKFSGVMD